MFYFNSFRAQRVQVCSLITERINDQNIQNFRRKRSVHRYMLRDITFMACSTRIIYLQWYGNKSFDEEIVRSIIMNNEHCSRYCCVNRFNFYRKMLDYFGAIQTLYCSDELASSDAIFRRECHFITRKRNT